MIRYFAIVVIMSIIWFYKTSLEKRKARAEGLAEGEDLRLIKLIKKKIQKSKNLIQIADELEETPESIQILYDCVKEHLQQDNEDIYDIYKNMK